MSILKYVVLEKLGKHVIELNILIKYSEVQAIIGNMAFLVFQEKYYTLCHIYIQESIQSSERFRCEMLTSILEKSCCGYKHIDPLNLGSF